jgi:serine/threonine-protein kinase
MLINEAKLLVTLNHPNIVRVYDLGFRSGAYFFVMEYVEGFDLRTILNRYGARGERIPLECTVLIAAELCKALDYAHIKTDAQGAPFHLVHLDVSPKNVLISYSGEVKLTDFGIASFQSATGIHEISTSGKPAPIACVDDLIGGPMVRGKFSYMSPEQTYGRDMDHRSDLFSLGLILYEMIADKRLYRSDTLHALQKEHREKRVQAPLFGADIPSELEYIVLRCLAYEPNDRYESAQGVLKDLLQFLYDSLSTIPHQQLTYMMEGLKSDVLAMDQSKKVAHECSTSHTISLKIPASAVEPRNRRSEDKATKLPVWAIFREKANKEVHGEEDTLARPPRQVLGRSGRYRTTDSHSLQKLARGRQNPPKLSPWENS